jgi:hypothetical protein
MSRRVRWALVAAGTLALLLVAAGIGLWWAARAYGPALARERVEAALAAALARPVRVEAVDLSPWLGRVTVRGVTVAAGPTWDAGVMLRVGRAEVTIGLSSLWGREVVLSRLLLTDLDLRIVEEEPAGPALPLALPERLDVGPVTVRLRTVEIQEGGLTYSDPAHRREVRVEGLRATARPRAAWVDATLRIEALRLRAPGLDEIVEGVGAEGRLQADRLVIRALTFRWEQREIRVAGEVTEPLADTEIKLEVHASILLSHINRFNLTKWPLDGEAHVVAALEGPLRAPRVSAEVTAARVAAGPLAASDLTVRGAWEDGTLRLVEIAARVFGGEMRGSLTVTPARPAETSLSVRLTGASVAALESFAGTPVGLGGSVSLEVALEGDPRRPVETRGHARLEAAGVSLPGGLSGLGAGTMEAEAAFEGGVAEVRRAEGRWPGVGIEVRGRAGLAGPMALDARVETDLAALAATWGRRGIAGTATLTARAGGRWAQPEMEGTVQAPALAVAGATLDRVEVPFRLAGRTVHFAAARGMLGQSELTASGLLQWAAALPPAPSLERDLRFQVEVRAPEARVEDLAVWLPPAWQGSGRFALTGRLEGTGAAWRGAGTVGASSVDLPYAPLRDLRAVFALGPQRLEVESLRARLHGLPVRAGGAWEWAGTGWAGAEVGPAPLAALPALPARLGLEGTGRARLGATLGPGGVAGSGTVALEGVSALGLSLGRGTLQIRLAGRDLQAEAAFPDAHLSGTAAGRLEEAGALAARLAMDDVAVAPIVAHFLPERAGQVDGTVSARGSITVPFREPAAVRGDVRLEPVRLVMAGERWDNRGPVLVRWEAGTLRLDGLHLAGRVGTITGSGALGEGGTLDAQIRGRVPLALLPTLHPAIREAEGMLDVTASAAGTLAAPAVTAEGTVRGGSLVIQDYPETLRELTARFLISPGGLRLLEATAALGGGRVRASGDLALLGREVGPYRLAATLRGVPLALGEGLEAVWDGNLELVGSGPAALLRGEVALVRGAYTRDLALLPLLLAPKGGRAAAPTFALPLRIQVRLENNFVVRTSLARLRAGGTLSLEGTTAAPILFGTIEAREGQVVFRGHRFTLVSASAQFIDPRGIDPFLDVVGTARIREHDVTVHLSGRAENLTVRFSSTPPLPQEDLVALVTLGMTQEEVARSPGGFLAREAAHILMQDFLGVQPGVTGLDVFAVELRGEARGTLRVGKQLTERTFILYSQSLADAGERTLRVEYQVLGPVLLTGEQDFQGGFGTDLVLRLRFR